MVNYQIRNFSVDDISALMQVQEEYAHKHPGVQILPGGIYLSPAFHQGQDVFCAFHPNGQMLGYSVLYVNSPHNDPPSPHVVWAEVKVLPSMNHLVGLRENLMEQILRRLREILLDQSLRKVEINFQYFPYETDSIAFVTSKGYRNQGSVYSMQRDLEHPLPSIHLPPGFLLKPWRLETDFEREQYIHARNLCFPNVPISLEEWIYFMGSPSWSTATNFAVFAADELAGCLTAYWDEENNRNQGTKIGYTEYIFVCPQWRGKGLASAMIASALEYLKTNGMHSAQLQANTNNREALALYERLGYVVVQESGLYSRPMEINK